MGRNRLYRLNLRSVREKCLRVNVEDKASLWHLRFGYLHHGGLKELAKKKLRLTKAELHSQSRRLENEKNELQSTLETELDQRSTDWSFNLEKYQSKEQRFRERVRDLVEQNVSLQKEVSNFHVKETESRSFMTNVEQQLKGLTTRMEEMRVENQGLQEKLSELQEKYKTSEEHRVCLRKNSEDRDKECKGLHKSITKL